MITEYNYKDLDETETADLHNFYWAAYNGLRTFVRMMILVKKWSPAMKSFQGCNVISAAIFNNQVKIVRELLQQISYQSAVRAIDPKTGKKRKVKIDKIFNIFGKDMNDNNTMHHAYLSNNLEIRAILRKFVGRDHL